MQDGKEIQGILEAIVFYLEKDCENFFVNQRRAIL